MRSSALPSLLAIPLLALATGLVAAPSSTVQDQRDSLTTELLDLSGGKRQIEQLPTLLKASVQPQGFTMVNPLVFEMLRAAMDKELVADRLYRRVFSEMKKAGTVDDLHAALALVRSPLALKFTSWEVESGKAESLPAAQAFGEELQKSPPPKDRLAILARLDEDQGGTEAFVDVQMASFMATAKATRESLPPQQRQPEEALAKQAEAFRAQISQAAKPQILMGMLFTYRNATQAELEQYATMLETPAGKWLSTTSTGALKAALTQAMEAVGHEFGLLLVEQIKKSKQGATASPASPAPPAPATPPTPAVDPTSAPPRR